MSLNKYLSRLNILSSSQLKWFALIFMTLDHLAAYGFEIPLFTKYYSALRFIGRLSMPLFLFVLAEGFLHTKSKRRFTLRLYIASVLVGLIWMTMNRIQNSQWIYFTSSSIIPTFFYIILYATLIGTGWRAIKKRALLRAAAFLLIIPATFLLGPLRDVFYAAVGDMQNGGLLRSLFECFLPQPTFVMYSIVVVGLGVAFCFCGSKYLRCAVFLCFSLAVFCLSSVSMGDMYTFVATNNIPGFAVRLLYDFADLSGYPQRYMFLALPFMLLYNGKRGSAPKYFFYVYYPTHIVLIQLASRAVLLSAAVLSVS